MRPDGVVGAVPKGLLHERVAETNALLIERRLDDALLHLALMRVADARNRHQHRIDRRAEDEQGGENGGDRPDLESLGVHCARVRGCRPGREFYRERVAARLTAGARMKWVVNALAIRPRQELRKYRAPRSF